MERASVACYRPPLQNSARTPFYVTLGESHLQVRVKCHDVADWHAADEARFVFPIPAATYNLAVGAGALEVPLFFDSCALVDTDQLHEPPYIWAQPPTAKLLGFQAP